MIKVLVKLPGQYPEVREIEPTYEAVRDLVDDWLEPLMCTPQADHGIIYYCGEEGKLKDREPNIACAGIYGRPFTIIVGNIVVVKYDKNDCMKSLTKDEIAFHKNWLDVRSV
jgi:hypothetical protein